MDETPTDLVAFEIDDSIQTIDLAVTLSSPARFLYEKSGFRVTEEFSAIIHSKQSSK